MQNIHKAASQSMQGFVKSGKQQGVHIYHQHDSMKAAGVHHVKSLRQIEVQLYCAALPPPADGVPDIDVNFGACNASWIRELQPPRPVFRAHAVQRQIAHQNARASFCWQ